MSLSLTFSIEKFLNEITPTYNLLIKLKTYMANYDTSKWKEEEGKLEPQWLSVAASLAFESFERYFRAAETEEYHWLQHMYFLASDQDLCLAYKSIVLCIYLCPVEGDTINVCRNGIKYTEAFRKENHLIPVLFPISLDTLQPIEDGLLLDASTLQPIDLEKLNAENKERFMSPWEIQTMAWFDVAQYVSQQGFQITEVTNIHELYPQILANTPEGKKCKIIVKAVPVGEKDKQHEFNVPMGANFKDLEGYFVYVWFSNVFNTLDFDETNLLREGGQYSSPIELIPLSEVSDRYPNIHLNISYFDANGQ